MKISLKKNKLLQYLTSRYCKSFLSRSIGYALRFSIGLIFAHDLGASGYGIYSYIFSIAAILSTIGILGIDNLSAQVIPRLVHNQKNITLAAYVLVSTIFPMFVASLLSVGTYYYFITFNHGHDANYIAIAMVSVPFVLLSQIRASYLNAIGKNGIAALFDNLFYPVLTILIYFSSKKLTPDTIYCAMLSCTLSWLVTGLFSTIIIRRQFPISFKNSYPELSNAVIILAKNLKFSPYIVANAFLITFMGRLNIFIIENFGTVSQVGSYTLVYRISELSRFIYDVTTVVAITYIGREVSANNFKNAKNAYFKSIKINAILGFPILLIGFLYSQQLLELFGTDFTGVSAEFNVMLIGNYIYTLFGCLFPAMYILNSHLAVTIILLFGCAINGIVAILAYPFAGLLGATIAYVISLIFIKFAALIYTRRLLNEFANE